MNKQNKSLHKKFKEITKKRFEYSSIWQDLSDNEKIEFTTNYINELRNLSYKNFAEAQYDLSSYYGFGIRISKKVYFYSHKKMLYWMLRAAKNKYPDAVANMAIYYESEPSIQNFNKALEFYELHDKIVGVKMGKNRKLFLKQLEKGLYVMGEDGIYKLKYNWRKLMKI